MRIAIVRIKGQVKVNYKEKETLNRLGLRTKYSCVVFEEPSKITLGMLKRVDSFVAHGELDDTTYKKLVEARGSKIKNFFRLHPPRKGIDAKKHFGVNKGVLGNNGKEISKLIERML